MTRTTNISWKKLTKTLKSPFKPSRKDKVKPKAPNGLILQTEDKSDKMIKDWKTLLAEISSKGEIPDSLIDKDNFPKSFKSLDKEMGFGHISSDKENVDAKIVLQGKNPFMDNNYGVLSPAFGDYLPYSQIYNVNSERTKNQTYFIVRHYLNTESLSEAELKDIQVASSDSEDIFSVENMARVETQVETQSSRASSGGNTGGSRMSGSKLLGQMESLVRGSSPVSGAVGVVLLTVHKANSIEKKGRVGKADPYVVMQLGDQKLKSGTVDNNHDPVWHFTGQLNVLDKDENIKLTVFDEDIGKDDFLGDANLSVEELRRSGEITNKVLNLENCKSGRLTISAKFVSLENMKKTKGKLSLIVHSGKKLEKKNKLKKADPYLVVKVGEENFKSATINNNNSPVWEFKVELDYMESSPRQASIEVFDDDIGKDAPIGNVTLDINEVVKASKIEQTYKLANCKTGELMISAFFSPTDANVVTEEIAVVTKTTQIQQTSPATAGSYPGLKFSRPVYIGEEFAVVERDSVSNWFLIVSPHQSLPINVSIVPYRRPSQSDSPLHLYCLPSGSFHGVRRVIHSGQGLRKCGFQSNCVLMEGRKCQVYTKENNEACGEILPYTWGRDLHDALVLKSGQQDFLDLLIKDSETGKLLTTLTLSFYHDSVDAA